MARHPNLSITQLEERAVPAASWGDAPMPVAVRISACALHDLLVAEDISSHVPTVALFDRVWEVAVALEGRLHSWAVTGAEHRTTLVTDLRRVAMATWRRLLARATRAASRKAKPRELTTQQAADLLGVSRPYVVKLVDNGDLPARTVGHYRRIPRQAVLDYRAKSHTTARSAASELSRMGKQGRTPANRAGDTPPSD